MINTSVQKSRQGIAYQDRYALLKFLEYFQQSRLREFYTDYSFNKEGNSLDIFVALINPIEEHIFEIKTGEKFKTDKVKKLSRELHILYEFSQKHNKVSKIFLVIDPEIHAEFLQNWKDLQIIKEKQGGKWGNETYSQVVKRCQGNFGFNKIRERDFIAFIRGVEFKMEYPNKKVENEKNSPLENVIIGKIKSICEKVKSNGADIEMPYWITMQELLETIRQGAADGTNILPPFVEVLRDSLARRDFIERRTEKAVGVSRPDSIDKQRKLIAKRLRDEYQKTTIDIKNKDSILQQINQIIQSRRYLENKDMILGFLKDQELRYYFLNKLPKKFDDLKEIEFLLNKLAKDERPYVLFDVLKNSITSKNNDYIINFIAQHYDDFVKSIAGQQTERVFQEKALRIIKEIIKLDSSQIEKVIKFLNKLCKKRRYNRRGIEERRSIEQEKQLVVEILFEISEKKGIGEDMLRFIESNFDLISDSMRFSYATPNPIFNILKNYISQSGDFEKAFKKITDILLNQYTQSDLYKGKDGKNKFEGYEWMGGGLSQAGFAFSITDFHFVEFVLRPTLDEYYSASPEKALNFVNTFCIHRNGKGEISITKEHPDFLLRTSLGVLLNEYKNENQDAKDILIEFLKIRKGIPSKDELIFQDISKKTIELTDEQRWELIKEQFSIALYRNLPANVFVLKVITDLAAQNHDEAMNLLLGLIKNPEFYKRIWHEELIIVEILDSILKSNSNKGVKGFKNHIQTEFFKKELDTFGAYNISHLFNSILNNPDLYPEGLKILEKLSGQPELTPNQQILICNGLIDARKNSDSENIEVLMKIYNDFLWPLLNEKLKRDLKRDYNNKDYGLIYHKFPFEGAREKFVQFAECLARKKKIREALNIINIFINDPHPFTPIITDPDDPKGEYDEHKRVLKGEDTMAITTIRGWCGWALLQCSVVESRPYIDEMISLAKRLIEDENLFVASYGANALSGLARNRLTVLPDDRNTLFFGKDTKNALENAKRIEAIAFDFLIKIKNYKKEFRENVQTSMADSLLHLFDSMRGLNEEDAKTFIEALSSMSSKVIHEAAPLFIYFAEFREKHLKEWKWQMPGLYDDLAEFDGEPFRKEIEKIIKRGNSEVNSSFAWQFWKLIGESVGDEVEVEDALKYSEAFEIAYHYLDIIADYYDRLTFSHIYRFIGENFEKRHKECYQLLEKALKTEKALIEEKVKKGEVDEIYWWPHYDIGEILIKVKENVGIPGFLDKFEFLLSYPKEARVGIINEAVTALNDLPFEYNQRIEGIFDKLIAIDPNFYDAKETWKRTRK